MHTVFARGGALDQPLDIEVEAMHVGRALGSATVTVRQGDRLCTRSLVLLSAVEPDLIRHGAESPAVGAPEDAPLSADEALLGDPGGRRRRPLDPDAVGPAELFVWSRFPGLGRCRHHRTGAARPTPPTGSSSGRPCGRTPGSARRCPMSDLDQRAHPHPDLSRADRGRGEWYLLAHESPYAGRGRSDGRANVFAEDGRLVASFVQENMVRAFPEGQSQAGGRSKF